MRRDQFVEVHLHALPLRLVEAVDIQRRLQVVKLVLEDARLRPPRELLLLRLALDVLVLDLDPRAALDVGGKSQERQAALLLDVLRRRVLNNLRVAQHDLRLPPLRVALGVKYHQPPADAELRSGEADATRCVHDGEHLLRQLLQLVVKVYHIGIRLAELRVR
eukprot:3883425-Prymnesium_polylepis.1